MSMIPYAERGKPVQPSAFNRLVDFVRSNLLTSVVGGRLIRTLGGTSIVIDQDTAAGGGGGAAALCPFKVTDATDAEGNMMVEVKYGEIAGRVPNGMVLDEPYLLDVSDTGRVYASLEFDAVTLDLISGPTAVNIFFQAGDPLPNTTTKQYSLLATVVVKDEAITTITNLCSTPTANVCSLAYV